MEALQRLFTRVRLTFLLLNIAFSITLLLHSLPMSIPVTNTPNTYYSLSQADERLLMLSGGKVWAVDTERTDGSYGKGFWVVTPRKLFSFIMSVKETSAVYELIR